MGDSKLSPKQLARGRAKFGSPMGAEPVKGETKATEDTRLLASPRSQEWLAKKSDQALADYHAGRAQPADEALAASDLRRWKARALKAVKAGKGAAVRFESEAIPEAGQSRIRAALEGAQSAGDVVKAFHEPPDAVKAVDTEELIDGEWDAALGWARKAMEG